MSYRIVNSRKFFQKIYTFILITVTSCISMSCTSKQIETGYSFAGTGLNEQNIDQYIVKGNIGELQVMQLLGSPTILDDIDSRRFYYIQNTYIKKPVVKPQLISRKILEIDFDNHHVVSRVNFYETKSQNQHKICDDTTVIEGNQMKLVQQFARNIGRFNSIAGSKNSR